LARLAICGWIAGGLLLVVMSIAFFSSDTRDGPYALALGPAEFSVDEDYLIFTLVIEGDAAWFRKHLTAMAWHNEVRWRVREDSAGVEIRATHGTTVNGRQVRLISPTWWLVVLLLLPGFWRWSAAIRARRMALMAGCCTFCGYDLRGSGGKCPECGAAQEQAAVSAKWVSARMWRRRPVFTALALLSILMACFVGGWWVASGKDSFTGRVFRITERWQVNCGDGLWSLDNSGWPRGSGHADTWMGVGFHARQWTVIPGVTTSNITITVHAIYLLLLTLTLPVWWWRVRRNDLRRIVAGSCPGCWLDMRGATGPCPRCGRVR
jgi:hypothetical protein